MAGQAFLHKKLLTTVLVDKVLRHA